LLNVSWLLTKKTCVNETILCSWGAVCIQGRAGTRNLTETLNITPRAFWQTPPKERKI
jgi:hypothetical protein